MPDLLPPHLFPFQLGEYPISTASLESLQQVNIAEVGNVGPCVMRVLSYPKSHQ